MKEPFYIEKFNSIEQYGKNIDFNFNTPIRFMVKNLLHNKCNLFLFAHICTPDNFK